MLICTSAMMSRSSTRNSYAAKRPLMTITYCRRLWAQERTYHIRMQPAELDLLKSHIVAFRLFLPSSTCCVAPNQVWQSSRKSTSILHNLVKSSLCSPFIASLQLGLLSCHAQECKVHLICMHCMRHFVFVVFVSVGCAPTSLPQRKVHHISTILET